ncbi:Drought induced 19 protein type zinc-binding domain [Arabidopsis thaliana x Arabidopsis arenosa]|uniref:Drought induced 19 protein type zinc-binding domain n=1 Tax=Arabidopsis thaliana x Arabidopsis arenosa TaxID=1240361 RepID=A0A8T1XGY1_9BRAS|nr:Drought induced 19 protein type zinc-binding domain [Arabidopsis thaliana x Arabidopsis arenosa]
MDSNSWTNCPPVFSSSSSSRRYQSRSDLYLGDVEGEDDLKAEFMCPFCADEFDIVGLCCHIDVNHPVEAKNGVCPVCTKRVGLDIVGHITTQHGSVFKVQRRRRLRKGGYSSAYLTLKKELREANLQSFGGSSTFIPSSNIDSDPLLSSFMFKPPLATPIAEGDSLANVSPKDTPKSNIRQVSLSIEDQEKAKKSEFVRGMLWSTMLEDKF